MRLTGYYRSGDQAPHIAATVLQEDLNIVGDVRFLVDSGSSSTVLSDLDVRRLGIDYTRLEQLSGGIIGVGGGVETYILPDVRLFFLTPSENYEEALDQIYVLKHQTSTATQRARIEKIPSILGRDFLNKYTVVLKQTERLVLITDKPELPQM